MVAFLARAQTPLPDDFNPGVAGQVHALAVQADGKILVGGSFTSLGGQPRTNLARLNPDGTLDLSFDPQADGTVYSLMVQDDDRILVGGSFSQIAGRLRESLARLNSDGAFDSGFAGWTYGEVRALALQPDGKIIVAGQFNSLDGEWCYSIGRLKADGTKDFGFSFDANGSPAVFAVAVQADGKILMGGSFSHFISGVACYRIARWNADGTLDSGFNPGSYDFDTASVNALAVQADGKILTGGTFTNMAGRTCHQIARLTTAGGFDSDFNQGANDRVSAFAVQADGRILVAGDFTTMSGQPRNRLARFNADGSLDASFNPGADSAVAALALQGDGRILTSGSFTSLGGRPRANFARLTNTDAATQSMTRDISSLTWLRDDTSAEVGRSVFEYSTNGVAWSRLGAGTRTAGGWQIAGVSPPANATLRARGFVTSGLGNASGGIVEDYLGAPLCLLQPANRTNNAGTVATFRVQAGGSEPIYLVWRKDGGALADGGKFAGTQTATLTVNNAQPGDEGGYSVVLSNSFGSVTSSVATLTVVDPGITSQPLSLNRELGQTAIFSVTTAGMSPFTFLWQKDGAPLPGATSAVLTLTNLLASDAGSYTVVICNSLGCITSSPALLTVNAATLDAGFDAGSGNNAVYALAVQTDGKILAGGTFYNLGGQSRSQIARLNADGSADGGFNPGADGAVFALVALPDGKLVAAGQFTQLGQACNHLGRLYSDGSFDSSFTNQPNGDVYSLAMQADGAVLIGGYFTSLGGQSRTNLARINPNGTLDTTFNPGICYGVLSLMAQPDGKILVGGYFTDLGGQPRTNLARLYPDGTLDAAFNPVMAGDDGYPEVTSLALQADGKILVGGTFSSVGGQPRANLARLNADGTVDAGFNPRASHDSLWQTPSVDSLSVQTDGKILVAGTFTTLAGQPRNYLGRLNSDGSLDPTFNLGADGPNLYLNSVTVQADGKILVGGAFSTLGGQAKTNLARINNTTPATENLSRGDSAITWLRGGSSPEVWRTTFEHSSNGIAWTNLGAGARIAGGWQLVSATLPAGGTVRARGFIAGSYQSGSSWFVETLIGAPVFTTPPADCVANAGSTVTFSVLANGPGPLSYQWMKDGVPLADEPGVAGATNATLTLTNVLKRAEASYRVSVSNASGSVISQAATLTVIDPVITMPPFSRYTEPCQTVTFNVTAAGTALNYQWWKDGMALAQATGSALTLTNLQFSDAGGYRVVVSNQFGSATSSVANLTVNLATLDTTFNPGAVGTVSALALQADGKIVLGGLFTSLAGQTRTRLGRLNANGSLDTGFNPVANATVYSLAVQPDGKILVGGDFTSLAGGSRSYLGRLNTNGTLDTTFTANLNGRAHAVLIQPDGKLIVSGSATVSLPVPPYTTTTGYLSRLATNGTFDASFITTSGVNGPVSSLAFQADGKIVAGGLFTTLRGQTRNRIGRLNADGSLDTAFNPGADGTVLTFAMQADGKILVGGYFKTLAGQSRTNLARLNPDGLADGNFAPAVAGGSSSSVYSIALQADGKILVSGLFTGIAGLPRSNLARLNADGTADASFNPLANNLVYGLAVQPDGNILAVGDFGQIGGQSRNRIARLNPTELATQNLDYNGATLTWQRGGSSPEVWRTAFEFSTNLTSWSLLGAGTRIAGGWKIGGLPLLPSGRVRARGYVTGGSFNASSWFSEKLLAVDPYAPPNILVRDGNFGFATNAFGFNISGLIGQAVVVETSTNLLNWRPLQTKSLDAPLFHFSDPASSNAPAGFYRARLVP